MGLDDRSRCLPLWHATGAVCFFCELLVAGDSGVDGAGPEVDAAGDGLGLGEALFAEPVGDGERARAVMAQDGDGLVFVELVEGARADLVHGHEEAVGDVRGRVLPGLADVEEKRRVLGGELLFELVDGDFEVHELRIKGRALSEICDVLMRTA